jgi:CHASE3 domain sensor protein
MRLIFGIIIFFGLINNGLAQVSVVAALENNKVLIGDQAVLHLEAKYPDNYKVLKIDLPPFDSIFAEINAKNPDPDPGQLEIVDISNWDTLIHNGLVTLSSNIKLTGWKPGVYYIPSIMFFFQKDNKNTQSKVTNQLALLVSSPISDEVAADTIKLAPIKDIIVEPLKLQDFLPFIIGLVVLAVMIILGVFFYRRYKNKDQFEKVRIRNRPAHEVAFEKLKQLKGANLWQQGMIKEYQSELSHIIREYVESRYEILALESTTDEIFNDLKEKDFDESLKDNLKEMLQLADLVKFAKAEPPVERHEQLMQFAEDFVNQTKKQPEVESVEKVVN